MLSGPFYLRSRFRALTLFWASILSQALVFGVSSAEPEKGPSDSFEGGLPFTRYYPLEEIGNVSRGASVAFDPLGRLVVVYQGTYAVLNDLSWIDMAEKDGRNDAFLKVATGPDEATYYGALGSWGILERRRNGKLRPRSFRPDACPDWVASTNFTSIVSLGQAMYFGGWNGFVRWDRVSGLNTFVAVPGLVSLFAYEGRLYVSSTGSGLQRLVDETDGLERVATGRFRPFRIVQTTELGDGRLLLLGQDRSLYRFDGKELERWWTELGDGASRWRSRTMECSSYPARARSCYR
jgi:hypothetical protein